ncbi:MAG: hypothetical protein IMY86_00225 [Chloroflexi bacterium]|nr:hypothetical protein [Chloroflexota bacterium]
MVINGQTLAQLPLFAGLGDDALREIKPHIHERAFSPGRSMDKLEDEKCKKEA